MAWLVLLLPAWHQQQYDANVTILLFKECPQLFRMLTALGQQQSTCYILHCHKVHWGFGEIRMHGGSDIQMLLTPWTSPIATAAHA